MAAGITCYGYTVLTKTAPGDIGDIQDDRADGLVYKTRTVNFPELIIDTNGKICISGGSSSRVNGMQHAKEIMKGAIVPSRKPASKPKKSSGGSPSTPSDGSSSDSGDSNTNEDDFKIDKKTSNAIYKKIKGWFTDAGIKDKTTDTPREVLEFIYTLSKCGIKYNKDWIEEYEKKMIKKEIDDDDVAKIMGVKAQFPEFNKLSQILFMIVCYLHKNKGIEVPIKQYFEVFNIKVDVLKARWFGALTPYTADGSKYVKALFTK